MTLRDTSGPLLTALHDDRFAKRTVMMAHENTTFGELRSTAMVFAERLTACGVKRLVVVAEPTIRTVTAVVAGLHAQVTIVPIPPDAGRLEVEHFVRDAAPDAWWGPAKVGQGNVPQLDELAANSHETAACQTLPKGEPSPAIMLYTSGTTGAPKGVMLSQEAIAAGLDGIAEAWDWTANDIHAHGLPLFHVHGLIAGCLGALRVGSSFRHVGKPTPDAYADAVAGGASLLFAVPTIWGRIANHPDAARALSPARLLVSGSAALPRPVFDKLKELTGHSIVERYGMTETLLTLAHRADSARVPGYVGWPIKGVEARVIGDDGTEVPRNGEHIGRLQVRGETLFDGYWGKPETTADEFTPDGWFMTGDMAAVAPDGNHRLVGRESVDVIKSGGFKVGAGEVESCLLAHDGVEEVAVVGIADADLGQRIVAFVVKAAAAQVSAQELAQFVADELSVHKRPREVVFVESLPRNAMGKVQKQRLMSEECRH